MYSRKRTSTRVRKRKLSYVESGSSEGDRSAKEEDDNLCPVCEDSCKCGQGGNSGAEEGSASAGTVAVRVEVQVEGTQGRVIEGEPLAKRQNLLVDYSSNTENSGFASSGGFTSEDDHIAYFLSDSSSSEESTGDCSGNEGDTSSEDEVDEITFTFTFPERKVEVPAPLVPQTIMTYTTQPLQTQQNQRQQPNAQGFAQIVLSRPGNYVDVYGAYYGFSDEESDESDFDETKVTVKIEDVIVESVTKMAGIRENSTSTNNGAKEEAMDLERWEKIPINAFRRRTRRLSVPSVALSEAIKNCVGRESIHSTLYSEPLVLSDIPSPLFQQLPGQGVGGGHRHSVIPALHPQSETPLSIVEDWSTCSSPTWTMDEFFQREDELCFWNEI